MGSEHYCLRWNNHQSNLLGVFSQLLQDESLVDVTLSCSEGAPIRAHKVVLSACSSYFQSLFLDHPERHPIVILKDVRFAELQTLVEFMYKGEVNVQYCQLSALLKTAESLKVKGLAEMTNQNTTLREPEREPDRLRPHSQTGKTTAATTTTCDSPVDGALAGPTSLSTTSTSSTTAASSTAASTAATAASSAAATTASATHSSTTSLSAAATATATTTTSNANVTSERSGSTAIVTTSTTTTLKRDASERCSPSPPKRLHASASNIAGSPAPLDLYQRRAETDISHAADATPSTSNNQANRCNTPSAADLSAATTSNNNGDERDFHSPDRLERPPSISMHHRGGAGDIEEIEDVDDDYDEEMDEDDDADNSSNEMGINLKNIAAMVAANAAAGHATAATGGAHSPLSTGGGGGDADSARSTPSAIAATACTAIPADLTQRPASRSSRDGAHAVAERPSSSGAYALASTSKHGGGGDLSPNAAATTSAVGASDALTESSGLGPVQSVPLSLKKEIDCSEDDNSSSRHMLLQPRSASAGGGLGSSGGGVAEMDYRASHESETSESPHGLGGGGGLGGNTSASAGAAGGNAASSSASLSSSSTHEQHQQHHHQQQQQQQQRPQTPPPIYPCVYCGATFPHQSKLTRHILSHSLKTLEYRETTTHALMHPHLLTPHDLNMAPLPQQFAYQMNAAMQSSGDPQEQAAALAAAAMEMESFAAAVAASGVCGLTGITSCGRGSSGMDLDGSEGGRRCSSTGNGGIGGSGSGSGGAGGSLLLSGAGSSSSSAAAASSSAALLGSASDPNSVVLCKFCGKSFPDVASLITHLPVHTGERPFKCEFCGKAFKLRHHMKDHCRVHTGERPFRCHMCGKTFSRSTILKAHEKTHFPKYVRKFLSPSPVETKDELPQ